MATVAGGRIQRERHWQNARRRPYGLADLVQASLAERAAAAAGVATMQEPATAAGPIRARPIARFPGAPWGCDGCNDCVTAEPTRVSGLIRRWRTTTAMADMRARGSGGIRHGQGTALADARPGGSDVDRRGSWRTDDEFMVGEQMRRRHRQRS